jgi:hypothetical protein
MEYTVIKTDDDRWGYELRDAAGLYAGNALTLEQLQRFALAEGARLRFEPTMDRGGRAGIALAWAGRLRALAGRLRSVADRRLATEVAVS